MGDAIFHRDGDLFVPSRLAVGPWSDATIHGGPPAGLLARCVEQHVGDPTMQLTRLTVDLFRPVPLAPLRVAVESVRSGRRIHIVQASIYADDVEVTRAHASFLRQTDVPPAGFEYPVPAGPTGLEVHRGFNRPAPGPTDGDTRPAVGRGGYLSIVEVAWATEPHAPRPAAWVRIPVPLVDGEEMSPATRAAALSDFGNAMASHFGNGGPPVLASYINSDITLYMHRKPTSEWLCIQMDYRDEVDGVGQIESVWFDERGRYGRGVQARISNPRERG